MPNELSILIRMDSFSFMIIDQSNIVSVFEEVPFKVKNHRFQHIDPVELLSIVQNNNLRHNRFEKVNISIDHQTFTYLPKELYEPESWFDYLNFVSTSVRKDDVVASDVDGMVCLYTYPLPVRKLLSTLYPTTQVRHLSESLFSFLMDEVGEDMTIFVLIHRSDEYLLVFEAGKLTLINRYYAPTSKDRLYYLLLTCKHRSLNPRKVYVKLTGTDDAVHELNDDLQQYFIHVHQIDWKNGWRLPLTVRNPMDLFEFYCIHHADHRG
ncbi:MAG: DUF3822 family protein [Saprospiraceae bacterium]|nr:DUF3822 family protein [Saprospiraceae bacterium]